MGTLDGIRAKGHVRWGIVGCGDVTEVKSGPAFARVTGSSLTAVMRRDADLAREVRQIWPLYTRAEPLLYLGVRGVVFHPITVTIREDGNPAEPGTRHLAFVAVPERLLHASDSHVLPTQDLFRLTAPRLPADWLRALYR